MTTLTEAKAQLAAWQAASLKVAKGQSYSISTEKGSRSLTRANSSEIIQQINFWQRQVNELSTSGNCRQSHSTASFNGGGNGY